MAQQPYVWAFSVKKTWSVPLWITLVRAFKSEASFIYDDDEVGVDVAGFPLIHNDKVFFANFQV